MEKLKAFDAYPKTVEDFRVRTVSGAVISLVCAVIMGWMFVSEFGYYLQTETRPEISIDTARSEKLAINFNITFSHIGCAFLGVDAMDVSGDHQVDIEHGVYKRRLAPNGQPLPEKARKEKVAKPAAEAAAAAAPVAAVTCGSCYGAETRAGQCCNTCEEVSAAYKVRGWEFDPTDVSQCTKEATTEEMEEQRGEGCNVYGFVSVNKVAGNFHIAPGKSYHQSSVHVHDTHMLGSSVNVSHVIHRLSFGEGFPGQVNPLDGARKTDHAGFSMFQYFVKIVPTKYSFLGGPVLSTNQYSVTENSKRAKAPAAETPTVAEAEKKEGARGHSHGGKQDEGLPGMFIMYDMSPVMIKFVEHRRSLAHFLTGVCAIVGGVFTVAGMVDALVYNSARALRKKVELGKQF